MGAVLELPVSLVEVNCGECAGTYAINERYHRQKREKGGTWTCPYCKTGWGFIESENTRLKNQLAEEKAKVEAEAARHQATLTRLNASERASKRLKARVQAGVCTCCNRTFANLARHMATKHKDAAS